ncbi:MAG TPA: sugar kinase [Pirellulales bacterium]|nr:sugar kinase [Pirellulales bacterium]
MNRVVAFGEIMGRLAAPRFQRFRQAMPGSLEMTFAGAEATVAVNIAQLGGQAAFVTALPEHAIADACIANLASTGVDTSHMVRTGNGRLGLYFLESGVDQRPYEVVYDRQGSSVAITPADAYDWNAIFDGAAWFHFTGITPALSANAAHVTRVALAEASRRGVRVSMDMNYRSKLWNWSPPQTARELARQTIAELLPQIDVFIGGLDDASELLGVRAAADALDPPGDVARQLGERYPRLTHVAMSLRESISATQTRWGGMLYVCKADEAFRAPVVEGRYQPYAIMQIIDRLGTGDAFAAGLIFALLTPELAAPQTAVEFAVAAGCLAHSIEGDFNFSTRAEIESLAGGAAGGRVRR